jgi:hypothetical protein
MYWLIPDRSDNGIHDLQYWFVWELQRIDLAQLQELSHWFTTTVREKYPAITAMDMQLPTLDGNMSVTVFRANPIFKQLYEWTATHDASWPTLHNQLTVLPASIDPTTGPLIQYRCRQTCNAAIVIRRISDGNYFQLVTRVQPVTRQNDKKSEFLPAILMSEALQGKMGPV